MKAIQKELGDGEDGQNELAELEQKIAATKFSKEARDKAEGELKKLKSMSPMSAEATVSRNYLDWLLSLPWGVKSRTRKDLGRAEAILDATTMVWTRSRSGSSSIWPCRPAARS
ncbi:ATP-dependent protease La [marine sediment metagenome]|uniref:ATP-dependent protease La n=1 Tax=marine sediment metagenome TaxID=412755 RepID=A0A1B6NX52_9ZZZZ